MKLLVCLLLFAVLTVEDPTYFAGGQWHTPLVLLAPFFRGSPLNPWDLSLVSLGLLAALQPQRLRQQVWPLNGALAVSAATLLLLVAWGVARGGDFRMSYFQIAALLRVFLVFPVVLTVFRTRRDLKLLAATVVVAALYRAGACIAAQRFFLARLGEVEWPEYMTDHYDSVLWAITVAGIAIWVLFGLRPRRLLAGVALAAPLLLAMNYNNRRLAWLQLMGALALALVALPRGRLRRRVHVSLLAAAPLLVVYVAAGWGRPGALFAPVRQIRSAVAGGPANESNLYRELENVGVVVTLQRSHLLGTGFGHRFEDVSNRYSAGMASIWSEYQYTPHNSVLGLAAYSGVVGFPLVWCFLPVGAFFAARALSFAQRPLDRPLAMTSFVYPLVYGFQAFGDMGFQSLKANVLLACALATAARLAVLTGAWPLGRARSRAPGLPALPAPAASAEPTEATT